MALLGFSPFASDAAEKFTQAIDSRHDTWYTQTELTISNPDLSVLTSRISHFVNLRKLNLHDCRLKELPPEVGNLGLLQELWLGNNPLSSDNLESILRTLSSLKTVHLTGADKTLSDMIRQKFPRIRVSVE